jgi:hypothetical protein
VCVCVCVCACVCVCLCLCLCLCVRVCVCGWGTNIFSSSKVSSSDSPTSADAEVGEKRAPRGRMKRTTYTAPRVPLRCSHPAEAACTERSLRRPGQRRCLKTWRQPCLHTPRERCFQLRLVNVWLSAPHLQLGRRRSQRRACILARRRSPTSFRTGPTRLALAHDADDLVVLFGGGCANARRGVSPWAPCNGTLLVFHGIVLEADLHARRSGPPNEGVTLLPHLVGREWPAAEFGFCLDLG